MWTPGLLFLLLMLQVLSIPADSSSETSLDEEPQGQQSHRGRLKYASKQLNSWFKNNYRGVGELLVASLAPVPVVGPGLAAAIKTLLLLAPQADTLDTVNSELKALDVKLDSFRAEMKWEAWAAGAYQIPVNNIENAWIKYTELERSNQKTENEALRKNFFTFYGQYVDSTLVLHQFLTAKPISITQNLGDLLASRLRCHEKDIKTQFLYLNKLMCKGNLLNEKYYEFMGTNTNARVNTAHKMASQSASALIASRQRCLSNSDAYIERDIFERIDDTKKHKQIEDRIRAFLAKTYDRYDFMVVAFTTRNSKHKLAILNRHVLSGFTEVKRGTVTVAVAKQVKGGHSKTAAVIEAIKECLSKGVKNCLNAAPKLKKCQGTIFGKRLSETYTALHAFRKEHQTSTNAADDEAIPEGSSSPPYVFTWQCRRTFGKLTVLVKSDEELEGKENLCTKVNCGQNGECVVVPGTFIAMCKCQYPYFGERCDTSLESYKTLLQQEPERRIQTPERFRKSMSVPPDNRRSRQSSSGRPSDRRSQKSTSRRPSGRKSRKSASRRPSGRKSRKSTSPGPSDRRSRKSASRRPSDLRSRKSASRRPSDLRSRKSASRRPSGRKSRKSSSRGSTDRRSRKSTSRRPSDLRSRQRTPDRSAQDGMKSFCGSLCVKRQNPELTNIAGNTKGPI